MSEVPTSAIRARCERFNTATTRIMDRQQAVELCFELAKDVEPLLDVNDRLLAEIERLNAALQQIQGDSCESSTSGLGSCYRWGRMDNARFGADRPCMPCIAHRALSVRTALATEVKP